MTCYYLDLGSASDWLKIFLIQSEALPRSGQWFVISMEFLPSFLGNWLPQSWWLALWNISCFLKAGFTGNGVGVRVGIRSVELYELEKTAFWFFLFRLRLRCLRSSENWVTWECVLWLVYPSVSASDSDVSRVGRKWKRSDSSDSDSVALMTSLTSPIFLFSLGHKRSYDPTYDSNSDSIVCENQPSFLLWLSNILSLVQILFFFISLYAKLHV